MNTYVDGQEQNEMATNTETIHPELKGLVAAGFTSEEIITLVLLQDRYQTGGSDRVSVVRHWEFLKHLVHNGKLDR